MVRACSPPRWSPRGGAAGAHAFGFRTAWINRAGLPDEYPDMAADVVARDLTGIIGYFESE